MNGPELDSRGYLVIVATVVVSLAVSTCGGTSRAKPEEEFAWLMEDALTPRMPGDWSLVGCEPRRILVSTYLDHYIDGYVCTWSGHYGDGEPKVRQEWFDEAGNGEREAKESSRQ